MNFRLWFETDEADLQYLLSLPGETGRIGKERGKIVSDGISLFRSPHGSYRYVMYIGGIPVSALQVMRRGRNGIIANVYTRPENRRQGLATQLFRYAQKDFKVINHSEHMTELGSSWRDGLFKR